MVIYEEDIELPPDISDRLLKPITEEQASRILADKELRAKCERTGIDLGLVVNSLRRTVQERWECHLSAMRFAAKMREAGRRLGYK